MEPTVIEKGSPWSYKKSECPPEGTTFGLRSIVTPKVLREVGYLDPLDSFIEIVKDYCVTLEEGLHYDSIMAYSGIGRPAITLNQIGENNNVTRERVRQVREIHVGRIRKLLKGFVIEGLVCDTDAIRQINLLRDKFFKYPLFVDSDVQDILISEGLSASGDRVHHLDLFFKVLGIECSNKLLFCV